MKPETVKEKVEKVLLPLLTLGLGFVISPFAREMWDYGANIVLPVLSPRARLSILATLSIISVALGSYIYVLTRLPIGLRYPFDKKRGFYFFKKTGIPICTKCLCDKAVPIYIQENRDGYQCKSCGREYCSASRKSGRKLS